MLAFVLTVPVGEAELAADALWALGVAAVEERGAADDPGIGTHDRFVELWTSLGDDPDTVTRAADAFPARWRWRTVEVDDAVVTSWRAHARPSWVAPDLVVLPAWLDHRVDAGVVAVHIEPGAVFGLGDHPSTVLALRALRGTWWPGATVLDVGCGSGVVAVTAALLGAPYVEAIDIAPAAVEATVDNAQRNGVAAQVVASTVPLHEVEASFDLVVANILAPTLIELSADLRERCAPSGVLVVSGLLEGSSTHVIAALEPMQVIDRLTLEGWEAVVLRH